MPIPIGQPRVTAAQVAERAGVSQPTVSLVLGAHPTARVAKATRERVLRAAEELGYRPNRLAQALVMRRSFTIGVLVPRLDNPVYSSVISGAEKVAAGAGYAVLLAEADHGSSHAHLLALRDRQVDGVIVCGFGESDLPADVLAEVHPVLVEQPSKHHPSISSDSERAGQLVAEHLLELGHREFAFIGPATDAQSFRLRERGFVRRLREAGIALESSRLRRISGTVAGGALAMRALLASSSRPTAVFCANDLIALGAHKACATAGLVLPRDLSLVGCDGIEIGSLVTPELTTVSVPQRELGARAVRLLLRRLDGQEVSSAPQVLPVRLLPRGTTGPVPHNS
ncbi:MAG: LacI family DNA-binding transcriptional regulator [Gemmatimonadaceae bacterium]